MTALDVIPFKVGETENAVPDVEASSSGGARADGGRNAVEIAVVDLFQARFWHLPLGPLIGAFLAGIGAVMRHLRGQSAP